MAERSIRITEFYRKTIIVDEKEGEDVLDSVQKVSDAHVKGEIILNDRDYDGVEIEPSPYFGNGTGEVVDEDVSAYLHLPDGEENV